MPKVAIVGAGPGGLTALLRMLVDLKNEDQQFDIDLFEKRSEQSFSKRPQLICLDDESINAIADMVDAKSMARLKAKANVINIPKYKKQSWILHIGEVQTFLLEQIKLRLSELSPAQQQRISLNFDSTVSILDLPTGYLRVRNAEQQSDYTEHYECVVKAHGGMNSTMFLLDSHGQKDRFKPYDDQERLQDNQAAVFFFLKGLRKPGSFPQLQFSKQDMKFLRTLGWKEEFLPNIYIITKQTDNGLVLSVVGETPAGTIEDAKKWMDAILRWHLTKLDANEGEYAEYDLSKLKFMQPSDDKSLSSFDDVKLYATKFGIDMSHVTDQVYHEEHLGSSTGVMMGDAASTANPYFVHGAATSIVQGATVGRNILKIIDGDLPYIDELKSVLDAHIVMQAKGMKAKHKI